MPMLITKLAPPNSVILVSDAGGGEIPEAMGTSLVSATNTCVAVGCLSEIDGQTQITLAPRAEIVRADKPIYEGVLRTPERLIVIASMLGQRLLELPVLQDVANVKIWVNDPNEPDDIVIGVE